MPFAAATNVMIALTGSLGQVQSELLSFEFVMGYFRSFFAVAIAFRYCFVYRFILHTQIILDAETFLFRFKDTS
jgi:hypothetical protein